MRQPSIAAGIVAGLVEFAAQQGADRHALAGKAGIDMAVLADPDYRLPFHSYAALMRAAREATGNGALALHFGAAIGMAELSIVGLIMEASPTMGDAFQQLLRYGRLAANLGAGSDPPFTLEHSGRRLFLVDRRQASIEMPAMTEETFAWLTCGPRRFLSRPHVLSVHLIHQRPDYAAEYERVLNCPAVFGAKWNALELHHEVADWPVAQEPRFTFGALCRDGDLLLARDKAEGSTRGRLEVALLEMLHRGEIESNAVALRLGCSRSTLFRRLREEGTTFSEVLEDLRSDMAMHYLRGGRVSVNDTAYLVGFSDPAAFSRAFKRRTGKSPGQFRREA